MINAMTHLKRMVAVPWFGHWTSQLTLSLVWTFFSQLSRGIVGGF
jgi:hypothetical protein